MSDDKPDDTKPPSFWRTAWEIEKSDFKSSLWFALFGGLLGGGLLAWVAFKIFGWDFAAMAIAFGAGFVIAAIVSWFMYQTSSLFD